MKWFFYRDFTVAQKFYVYDKMFRNEWNPVHSLWTRTNLMWNVINLNNFSSVLLTYWFNDINIFIFLTVFFFNFSVILILTFFFILPLRPSRTFIQKKIIFLLWIKTTLKYLATGTNANYRLLLLLCLLCFLLLLWRLGLQSLWLLLPLLKLLLPLVEVPVSFELNFRKELKKIKF